MSFRPFPFLFSMEEDLAALSARCDFCDASYENMRRELKTYVHKKKETALETETLISLFKNVASAEPNSEMQKTIFSMATQYDSLRTHLDIYAECEEQTAMILDEAKLYVVSPVRDVLLDTKQAAARAPSKKTVGGMSLDQYKYTLCEDTLPVHARFFEKHRLKYLRGVLRNLIYSELKYHCRVVEELSPLLALLSYNDREEDENSLVHFS